LLNALTGTEAARAEDRLFATLDPTSRAVKLGDGQSVIATDTESTPQTAFMQFILTVSTPIL